MRSSIFDTERKAPPRSLVRSRVGSASPNLKGKDAKKTPKLYKEDRPVPWNVDEMLNAYVEHRLLPPLLSPTLPDFDTQKFDFEKSDVSELPLAQLTPRGLPVKPGHIDTGSSKVPADVAILVVLTPRLSTPSSVTNKPRDLDLKVKKKTRIRWVNRMGDDTPRFLLRFLYNTDKLQRAKVTGLGISLGELKSKEQRELKEQKEQKEQKELKEKELKEKELKLSPAKAPTRPSTPNSTSRASSRPGSVRPGTPTGPASMGQKDSLGNLKPAQDEDFIKLKTFWIKLAKESKFMAGQTEGILSLVIEFDALILFTIAYDYDEKLKNRMNISPLDRYWITLFDDIKATIKRVEIYLNSPKFEPIRNYLRCFVSVLHKFSIIVMQKMSSIYEELSTKEQDISKKADLQSKCLAMSKNVASSYKKSEIVCPNLDFFFKANFPTIWQNRCKNLNDLKPINHLVPISQNYYLPINHYTTLSEFVSVFHHLVNGFITVHNNIFQEDLIYSLKSGLDGP